jgi:NAD(P)-dependent dehydrogenase (short-subunit alcohol dehydrogenase family)
LRIEGSVVVVTGGSSGLGEASARRLLRLGARAVYSLNTNEERGKALEEELGAGFRCIRTDVAVEVEVDSAVARIQEREGAIHVVINAAAVTGPATLLSRRRGHLDMSVFDRVMKINLYGPVMVMRAAAAVMADNEANDEGERGVLINVSSGAAFEGQVGQLAYSASKGALVSITMPLFRELARHGIRVMTVAPGGFDTPAYHARDGLKESLAAQSLFPRRLGNPDEFALLVEEIVRNPMHNGRTIRLDAGLILSPQG